MSRVEFVAPPFAGHLYPMLPLARAALDAGWEVAVLTGEAKHAAVRAAGLAPVDLKSVPAGALEAIADTGSRVGSSPRKLLNQFGENLRMLPAIAAELEARWRAARPHAIVADSVAPVAGLVAERLEIPWITTIATPFALENRSGVPAYCGGWSPGGWPGRDAVGRMAIRAFKRFAVAWFRKEFAALGGRFPYRSDGTEAIYSSRAILGFGISELEFPRDWPHGFTMIGPVVESPGDPPPVEYPDRPRVLVTTGTHLPWAKATLASDAARLARAFPETAFVVSLGDASAPALPPPAPNVTVLPYVPYHRDIGRFDAVVHHGGAGITYAAILAGVPSVAVPHDYDQFDFAARLSYSGAGLRASTIAGAGPALARILTQGRTPALAELQAAALRYQPAATFLSHLNLCVPAPTR